MLAYVVAMSAAGTVAIDVLRPILDRPSESIVPLVFRVTAGWVLLTVSTLSALARYRGVWKAWVAAAAVVAVGVATQILPVDRDAALLEELLIRLCCAAAIVSAARHGAEQAALGAASAAPTEHGAYALAGSAVAVAGILAAMKLNARGVVAAFIALASAAGFIALAVRRRGDLTDSDGVPPMALSRAAWLGARATLVAAFASTLVWLFLWLVAVLASAGP